jgi:hypothetical protein
MPAKAFSGGKKEKAARLWNSAANQMVPGPHTQTGR